MTVHRLVGGPYDGVRLDVADNCHHVVLLKNPVPEPWPEELTPSLAEKYGTIIYHRAAEGFVYAEDAPWV